MNRSNPSASRLAGVLIANRGEIAVRIIRTALEMGIRVVGIHADDDVSALHVRRADTAVALGTDGPAAYLDIERVVQIAVDSGCDAIHPGYGFLSEDPALARACERAGLTFVGPTPETLELFGDKSAARRLATGHGVPVLAGTDGPTDLEGAHAFFAELPAGSAMLVKAVAGGGGRGMRLVRHRSEIDTAVERCTAEAQRWFGRGDVFVEEYLERARHIEVQVVGDGRGAVVHLGERECSIQRAHQKLIEIAPCPDLPPGLRTRICDAAVRMAAGASYRGVGTFEFLVDAGTWSDEARFAFIEANPRLQVEHTVTEEVTGVDLVRVQLALASGATVTELLDAPTSVRGHAIQARVNMEHLTPDGTVQPTGGTIGTVELPAGPGVRVDTYASTGLAVSSRYDSLLAKVIVHSPRPEFADALARGRRALSELEITGVGTNIAVLRRLLAHPEVEACRITTTFLDEHLADLVPAPEQGHGDGIGDAASRDDPLAVLAYGKESAVAAAPRPPAVEAPPGSITVAAALQGTVVEVGVEIGSTVTEDAAAIVLESMKMEHVVSSDVAGIVTAIAVAPGDTVHPGDPLLFVQPAEVDRSAVATDVAIDLDHVRPDLAEVVERHRFGLDEARPDAVARRRATGQRTARENVDDLLDPGSYIEYGPLVIAAQRARRDVDDLIARTPGDGMVAGIGTVNHETFGDERSRCIVMSYDYTVLAGTQGLQNHRKKDRLFEIAERQQLPVVLFAEGGGGRPGDTDGLGVAGLDCLAFLYFGRLSGLVPLIGITSGRCFAGNAALLGSCDVVIATKGSNIGMGGPAMVEGGGLGVYRPEDIGPLEVQTANGVVDIAVDDEVEAVAVAKRYLGYFQGTSPDWECADQRLLRSLVPENRLRIYDVRRVIGSMCDTDSVLELRRSFGHGMITALTRIEGRPVGVVANDPTHLGGAIDASGADKAVRFMQLCDAFDVPLLFLCDTPGIMVGPRSEETANVRHAARMFVNGANLTVPFFTIVLRKGYGLGAQAMAGGSFHAPLFTVAWPTGEFGGMGLEGAVKLGYRKELAALEDPQDRTELYDTLVAQMYAHGKATSMASHFEIDGVIDPADSRHWITSALATSPSPVWPRTGKKRPCVDTW